MLRMAVADYPDLMVDDREVRREGYSYMVDTLAEIRGEEGDAPLALIIGQDAVNHFDHWHRWREVFDLAHLVVMRRPGSRHAYSGELFEVLQPRMTDDPAAIARAPQGCVLNLEVTQLEISSTEIRDLISRGRSPRFLLPESVIRYIKAHRLYGG